MSTREEAVTAENFGERMRERMPSHSVWRETGSVPAMSRMAQEAMWEEMRDRLRTLEQERKAAARRRRWYRLQQRLGRSNNRSVAAVVICAGLLAYALFELLR